MNCLIDGPSLLVFWLQIIFGVLGTVLQGLNLGWLFGMRLKKIKVSILTDEGASPKCIVTMKGEDGESLADLRVRLKEKKILKFKF